MNFVAVTRRTPVLRHPVEPSAIGTLIRGERFGFPAPMPARVRCSDWFLALVDRLAGGPATATGAAATTGPENTLSPGHAR